MNLSKANMALHLMPLQIQEVHQQVLEEVVIIDQIQEISVNNQLIPITLHLSPKTLRIRESEIFSLLKLGQMILNQT
jgi:hypothetical protein